MTKKEQALADRKEAIDILRNSYKIKPGTKIYTNCVHVSRSGMLRKIAVYIITKDKYSNNKPYPASITHYVARAIGATYDNKAGAINIGGCGFDAGFEVVYRLGLALWPNGTKKPHGMRNGEPDTNGGYALKQEGL